MLEMTRKKGIKEKLIERLEEVLRKTISRIKVGKKLGKGFWTARVFIELLVEEKWER